MSLIELLILLFIAGLCGSISRALVGTTRGGCLVSILLGFIGALLGTWLARQAGLPEILPIQVGDNAFPVVWSVIGGALFVAVLALISGRKRL